MLLGLSLLAVCSLGILFGWLAFFRLRTLEKEIAGLRQSLSQRSSPSAKTEQEDISDHLEISIPDAVTTDPRATPEPAAITVAPASAPDPVTETHRPPMADKNTPNTWPGNWMIWLGGFCIALAGIFMVRYSIEAGLLGPKARIALAVITGIGFHLLAAWLHRNRGHHPAFAALAGGASITLFGAVLAALHLYHLVSVNVAFGLLTLVSLATMALCLRHGPVLAAIGLLGAYVVPILVSTAQGSVVSAMIYALIVSGAGLLLLRYVFRDWLWWGLMAGLVGWWALSLGTNQADDIRGYYLAAACYLILAVAAGDWWLQGIGHGNLDKPAAFYRQKVSFLQAGLILLILAWAYSVATSSFGPASPWQWLPLVLVIGLAAREDHRVIALPWLTLISLLLALLVGQLQHNDRSTGFQLLQFTVDEAAMLHRFALVMTLMYTALGMFALRSRGFSHTWSSLASLAPLSWLALVYVLTGDLSGSWQWSLATITAGLGYGLLCARHLNKSPAHPAAAWYTLASHLAYSLAVAMYFREAGLTLALAAQLISLCWLTQRYRLPWMHWLIKGVLTLVIVRLTLNPWLLSYPSDIHWSLWTYGGATLCCLISGRLLPEESSVRQWLAAATIHLLVLTLAAEIRYWLYQGDIFASRFSFREAAIDCSLWAAMALTYYYRSYASGHFARLYRVASVALMIAACCSYGLLLTILNPIWNEGQVSDRPLLNLLLLAYGLPVILAALTHYLWFPACRRLAAVIAGLGLLAFVSLEIRHLWQGGFDPAPGISAGMANGELYTYSAAWLALAVTAIVIGSVRHQADLNRGGLLLLAVVIGKIFLVDMAGLEGLLRVASFMGLGLSLLGLAYLRSRLEAATAVPK
jgi:uncharacterized membrane protein